MELLKANLVNTTTQLVVQSNTALAANLFNPDRILQYFSDGYDNDMTTTTLTVNFDATTSVSRIAVLEHNLKDFLIYYNGVTANALTISGPTTTTNWSSNSQTSHFLTIPTPIDCTSISIDMKKTISANSEKAIGLLVLSSVELSFSQIPNAANYTPALDPKQIVHTLSDGGTRIHVIRDKWKAKLKLPHVTESFRDSLRDVYDQAIPFMFVPFGTHTSWDGILFECVWVGPFDFYKYTENTPDSGFSGSIEFRETPS